MERIGIFVANFDPPQQGHMEAVERCLQHGGLHRMLLVPAACLSGKPAVRAWELLTTATRNREGITLPREALDGKSADEARTWLASWLEKGAVAVLDGEEFSAPGTAGIPEQYGAIVLPVEGKLPKDTRLWGASPECCPTTPILHTAQMERLLAFRCGGEFLPESVLERIREERWYDTRADWKNLPMEELEKIVVHLLNPNRVAHVLGCRDTAVALARRWGENETDAARAGLLHDITKAIDGPLQLTLCAAYGKMLSDFSRKYPKTLHALTGSLVARRIFGENENVVRAICYHTTGRGDMTLLEKIIYVADYMEPNRDFPGVEQLRTLAQTDLDGAVKLGLEMTLCHLQEQGAEVSPESREALAWLRRMENQ